MRTLKYLLLAVVFLFVVAVIVGLFLPAKIQLQRSIEINRDAETVYKTLNTMSTFSDWSPWLDQDPNVVIETTGAEFGKGSKVSWKGDSSVDEGYMEITQSSDNESVVSKISFGPSNREAISVFKISESMHSTELVWSVELDAGNNLLMRYSGLAIDDILGKDIEKGLNNIKDLIESLPLFDYSMISEVSLDPEPVYAVSIGEGFANEELAQEISNAYASILSFFSENSIQMSGFPLVITQIMENNTYQLVAALPVLEHSDVEPNEGIQARSLPAGRAIKMIHQGSYDDLSGSYDVINAYVHQNQLKVRGDSWESYVSDPGSVEEKELITHIYLPIEE